VSAPSWRPTAAVVRVTVLPAALGAAAVLARRVDLLALAAPLALAALPLLRGPIGRPQARLAVSDEYPAEGGTVQVAVRLTGAGQAETMTAAVSSPDWLRPPTRRRISAVTAVHPDGSAELAADLRAQRWGRSAVGPAVVTVSAAWGLLRYGPLQLPERRVQVFPLSARYRGSALVPRAGGNVGLHRSLRAGPGTELAGIRPFAPGDRRHRINWRVSLRTGELQVNASTTERDADIVLLLDGRYDSGTSGGIDGSASGIDVAVRATAALSAFYLGLGDRVGLFTYTAVPRQLPARAGRRHLQLLLHALLDVEAPQRGGAEPPMPAPVGIDARALVLVVSPLVGHHVFTRVAALARAGHSVIAVDTLPDGIEPEGGDQWSLPALRLWHVERSTRIAQLRDIGVPVVAWLGSGSLDAVLEDLARIAARSGRRA
jgi:uncharacterized protein (DUF58 family)